MKNKILLIINLVILSLLFLFGNSLTTIPGRSSGNGNPAIMLLIPLSILFIILILQWIYLFKDKKISLKNLLTGLIVIVVHFLVGINYQLVRHRKYRNFLAEVYEDNYGFKDWEYINSITTGFSIHINNQFFNWNTFFLLVSLSIFIWLLFCLIKIVITARKHK